MFRQSQYFIFSIVFHVAILLLLVLGYEFVTPLPVIENTNKNDVISAVILGDIPQSKILPKQQASQPIPTPVKEMPKPVVKPKLQPAPVDKDEDVIALKKAEDKKKQAEKKLLDAIKQPNLFAKDLLSDIKKQNEKQKKIKQKQLQTQFQKTLHQQAEKSLRQQLLNEDVKLQSTQSRQSQGEINKYKALILQAISDHWIIPTQANRHLYSELMIRLAPGGTVLDVQVTKSSGDPSLDSSARAAVLKASPLPVPPNANDFEVFRQFVLKVKPENVITNESS